MNQTTTFKLNLSQAGEADINTIEMSMVQPKKNKKQKVKQAWMSEEIVVNTGFYSSAWTGGEILSFCRQ